MGLLLVLAEVIFLIRGGWRSAIDDYDRTAFVVLAIVLSLGIAFLPSAAYRLFLSKRHVVGGLACVAWLLVAAYAWGTTVSVSAINRAEIESDRQAHLTKATYSGAEVDDLARKLAKVEEELNFLAQSDPPETIQGRINALKQGKRWEATSQCTNATTSKSRKYCAEIAKLEGDKALAGRRLELEAVRDTTAKALGEARAVALEAKPEALSSVDPEFRVLASMAVWSEAPGAHAVWAAEMFRHANLAFVLLLSAIVNLVATALSVKIETPIIPTGHRTGSGVPEVPAPQPEPMPEPVRTMDFEALRKRLMGFVRPTAPSAPMIEAGAA
jgi:hypothetical protein